MAAERPVGYENKHLEVPQNSAVVDNVTNTYGIFFWQVQSTQTIVSKESHLKSGDFNPDNLYSVTTTERFVAIDLKRPTNIANLSKIKQIEKQYFDICASLSNLGCSPLDNYSSEPKKQMNWILLFIFFGLWIVPAILYWIYVGKKHTKALGQWKQLKTQLDGLLNDNKSVLNLPS